MYWIAFFSQTGSEIAHLSKELGRSPDLILTNNKDVSTYHPDMVLLSIPMYVAGHDSLMQFLRDNYNNPKEVLITLHGYLRIIPPDVCERFEIYNGHPGYITAYPELKGKDPQVRAWEARHRWVGCVIHKVTAGVDEGPIVDQTGVPNTANSLDELYSLLKRKSLYLWKKFMWGKLNENSHKRSSVSR